MPMRQDCKFFESRTYANGDTVRKCDLNLAPEAPWRCPADCPAYERRLADVAWQHGSLITPPTPAEPAALDEHGQDIAALLAEAAAIVNAAGPTVKAEVEQDRRRAALQQQRGMRNRLRRLFRRS